MGKEAVCRVRHGENDQEARVSLEEDGLRVRGLRLHLPLHEISEASVAGDDLVIRSFAGELTLTLGKPAASWAKYIAQPPTLLTKLGLKPAHRIAALDLPDLAFLEDLPRETSLASGARYDAVLLHVRRTAELRNLREVSRAVAPKGMLWIVYPRGQKDPSEGHVLAAGRGAGLNDVKVCRFSDTHTGLKFVHRAA